MVFVCGPERFETLHFVKKGEPKRVSFIYDLSLNQEGNPPVDHLRFEEITFNNPTKEFHHKLIKAGGVSSHGVQIQHGCEIFLGPVPSSFTVLPKHKADS